MTFNSEKRDGHGMAMARLRRFAQMVRLSSYAAAVLMVLGMIWLWSDPEQITHYARMGIGVANVPVASTSRSFWLALALCSIPAGLFIYVMIRLAGLFGRFGKGQVLKEENAVALSRIGWWFVALGLITPVARALQSVALTFDNPPGQRQLAVMLDRGIFGALAAGAALVAFGLVLREAIRLADENDSFV
jgi:hypothetical protein